MPRDVTYNYDIKKIGDLLNEGLSERSIAKEIGVNHSVLSRWLRRNVEVEKIVKLTYNPKKKKSSVKT